MKLEFLMATMAVSAAAAFADSVWTGGATLSGADWSDETKWSGGAPTANSTVQFPNPVTANVDDDTCAAVSSFYKIILADAGGKIAFDVSSNSVCTALICGGGSLEKTGSGILRLDGYEESDYISYGGYGNYNLLGGFDVIEGGLAWPDNKASVQATYGHVHLAAGATFYISTTKATNIGGLSGEGIVTNTAAETQTLYIGYPDKDDHDSFAGEIGGAVGLIVACEQKLLGSRNVFSGVAKPRGGADGKVGGVMSFVAAGENANDPSSLGLNGDLSHLAGGCFRYIGPGGERTFKRLMLWQDAAHAVTLDAGPNGGLEFAGEWFNFNSTADPKSRSMGELVLSGSNLTTACSFSGKFRAELTDTNDCPVATRFTKKGPGVWHLQDHAERLNRGVVAVQEGTLRYDSVEEQGVVCSLGLSTVLCENYYGPWDESRKVDHAFELGAAQTQGTLEFAGSNTCATMTRPIALAGDGVLMASGADGAGINYDGVSALAGGAAVKTLTLAGDSTADNYVGGVRDGQGRIAVVKEGAGTWTLRGDQTFSGDLTVKAGTLVVQKKKPFDWFRLTVTESGNANMTSRQIAFYDKDGTYVNWGMTWNKNRVAPYYSGTTPTTSETGYRYRNLGPSEATFGRSDYGLNNSTFASLFSQGGSASFACYGINPASPSNPSTWVPIVFRMPKGSNAIVAFDYAPYAGASYLAVKAYTLEGSADGQHWYEVAKDGSFNYSHTLNNSQQWIYTQRGDNVSTEANTKKIRLLADGETKALEYTCETNDYSVLENVGVVTVANGATLKAEGDFTPEIRRLGIDAQTGAGTIDGFTLADGAEIFVTGTFPNEGFTVPVSFSGLGDVATATGLAVKDSTGKTRSWSVKLTETSATFAPSGIIISIR